MGNPGGHPPQFTDALGQVFTYKPEVNSYIQTGAKYSLPIVDQNADGLVTAQIQRLLEDVQQASDLGEFSGIKFLANPNVYWYFLKGDRFISLSPTGEYVQIEINNNKLVRELYTRLICHGPVGSQGLSGAQGRVGTPGPSERTIQATAVDQMLSVDTTVPTPLETPISIRLFNLLIKMDLEIRLAMRGTWQITKGQISIDVNTSAVAVDRTTDRFAARLNRTDRPWEAGWQAKVRQIGPTGNPGYNGSGFLTILNGQIVGVKSLSAIQAIVPDGYDLRYHLGPQLKFLVKHLKPTNDLEFTTVPTVISSLATPMPDLWAAVEVNKSGLAVTRWGLDGADEGRSRYNIPLDLPQWTPLHVVGYGGWSGFKQADEIPICQEDLFICLTDLQSPRCVDSSSSSTMQSHDSSSTNGMSPHPDDLSSQSTLSSSSSSDKLQSSSSSSDKLQSSSSSSDKSQSSSSSSDKSQSSSSSSDKSQSSSSSSDKSQSSSSHSSQSASSQSASSQSASSQSASSQSASSQSSQSASSQSQLIPRAMPMQVRGLVGQYAASDVWDLSHGQQMRSWTNASESTSRSLVLSPAFQSAGDKRPTYIANAINGLPAIRFKASDQQHLMIDGPIAGSCTIFLVARQTGTPGRVLSGRDNNWFLGFWKDQKDLAYFEGWAAGPNATPPTFGAWPNPSLSDSNWHCYRSVQDGTISRVYGDGGLLAESATALAVPKGLILGGSLDEFTDCDIAEILIYDRALDNLERLTVENHLHEKYGLQVGQEIEVYNYSAASQSIQGDWIGRYGSSGYCLASSGGVIQSLPSYAGLLTRGHTMVDWQDSPSDYRALLRPTRGRIASAFQALNGQCDFLVGMRDSLTHKISVYLLDPDGGRDSSVQLIDSNVNKVLYDSGSIGDYRSGAWLSWYLRGSSIVRISSLGGPEACVSGIFFD